jgi:2'-5' RNA ligase
MAPSLRAPAADADELETHWYWRPGWRAGRRGYTWHVVSLPGLAEHAAAYQAVLEPLRDTVVDLVPPPWLHLTVQGVGFVDEVPDSQIAAMLAAAKQALADTGPLELSFDRPMIRPEAIAIHPTPTAGLVAMRQSLRDAAAGAGLQLDGPDPEAWQPHVSIAYVHTPGPADPVRHALAQVQQPPVTVTADSVTLIQLYRENGGHLYVWDAVADIDLS